MNIIFMAINFSKILYINTRDYFGELNLMTPINGINPYMLNALNAGNPFGSAEFSSCMASIFSNLSSLNSINLNSFSPMTFNMPNFSNFNFGNLTMPSFNFSNYFHQAQLQQQAETVHLVQT